MQKNMQLNMPSISQMQAIAKKMAGISTSDLKFFTTTKKGEIHELREELNQQSRDKKKDAVKKVIANMTVGKDVSMLFTDVVNCIQTADTQLKKLVYLYLINYAKSHPDLAILAVNTFVKDANDPNPLIRALSIRTMGCIRVDRIAEYLCEPLRRCLQDDDPYVRKTAAICVAKLYDINAQLVEEQGFLDSLQELISDSNPTVVANAVAALSEISDTSKKNLFDISKSILQKLLAALNECTEWGQVLILDALAKYTPSDDREAENIIERITPRLQHANSAVVLSAVKVIMGLLDRLTNNDTIRNVTRKLAPPLVTLLSTEPEIQYVALRNINLIVQKRPTILSNEIKVFFCKYNDPIYVKMEKLEIIIKLVADRNIEQVLLELKEYATEVDVDFVRKSVRAIGRCAIKLDIATERCINLLLELIQTKVNYIVQEAIIVIKDIFRKYPNQYESIIATLCDNLETLDEPEAKASMVWIIGEYAERIDNADELLKGFLDGFDDETSQVQLQLLTATVKLFLKRPQDTQDLVQKVLNLATENSDNPDLRDRGYVYWRLLSSSPEAARAVVWATKPTISDDTFSFDSKLLDKLLGQIATLSSVYHKLPDTFVSNVSMKEAKELDDLNKEDVAGPIDSNEEESISTKDEAKASTNAKTGSAEIDLLNMGGDVPVQPSNQPSTVATSLVDIFGSPSPPAPSVLPETANNKVLTSQKGLVIKGGLNQKSSQLILNLMIENQTSVPLTGFAIQLNKSTFGLAPEKTQFMFDAPIKPGGTASTPVNLRVDPAFVNVTAPPASSLQAALKNMANGDVIYFNIDYDLDILYGSNSNVDKNEFVTLWKSLPENPNAYSRVDRISKDLDALSGSLEKYRVYYIAKRVNSGAQPSVVAYFSAKTLNNAVALFELSFEGNNFKTCRVAVKTDYDIYLPLFQKSIESLLQK